MNCTVPVGAPAPGATTETDAVNVTDCPKTEGFALEVTAVDVSALFTTWLKIDDVLMLKFVSPLNTAVIECGPTDKDDVLSIAVPPLNVAVPNVVAPSLKVTVPVGEPAPGATTETAAVNVINCPKTDGFALDATVVDVSALFTTCGLTVSDPVLLLKLLSPP